MQRDKFTFSLQNISGGCYRICNMITLECTRWWLHPQVKLTYQPFNKARRLQLIQCLGYRLDEQGVVVRVAEQERGVMLAMHHHQVSS